MLTSQGVREGDLVGFQILRSSCQSLKMQGFLAVCTSSFVRRFSFRMNLYDVVVWITPLHRGHCLNYWTGRTFHSDHLSLVDQVNAGYRQLIHGALAMCIRGANHPASSMVLFKKHARYALRITLSDLASRPSSSRNQPLRRENK